MLTRQVAEFLLAACVRARLSIVFAGPPGSGKTTLLSCCDGRARPVPAGRDRRGGVRGRHPRAQRGPDADPRRPRRTGRPSTSGASSPGSCAWPPTSPSSARCATARRCPLLLTLSSGVNGLHDDPRRVGPPGADPAAVHLPAGGHVGRAAAGRAEHARERERRRRRALRPHGGRAAGDRGRRWSRTWPAGRDATQFTVTEVFRRPGPDQPLAWTGDVPARAARALADAGVRPARPCSSGRSGATSDRAACWPRARAGGRLLPVHRGGARLAGPAAGPGTRAARGPSPAGRRRTGWCRRVWQASDVRRVRRSSPPRWPPVGALVGLAVFGGPAAGARAGRVPRGRAGWRRTGVRRVAAAGRGAGGVAADHRGDPDPDLVARPVGAPGAVRGRPALRPRACGRRSRRPSASGCCRPTSPARCAC